MFIFLITAITKKTSILQNNTVIIVIKYFMQFPLVTLNLNLKKL